ncbi:MAG: hypothetical protein O2821_08400 [Chloroflexi bacterium]|nr:hypothetical protein [Chloroflexota bacterium]MDA1228946.1 hypothetical protein [Chloroflexota bacterium]
MAFFMAMGLRGGLSFIFAMIIGFAGFVVAGATGHSAAVEIEWFVWGTSIGAGTAAFISWLKPETRYQIIFVGLIVAFSGAILGSWLGLWYGEAAYPDGVRNVRFAFSGDARSPAFWTFITGAALLSTLFGAIYYGFRLWRYHEM